MNTPFWKSSLLLAGVFPLILGLQLGAVWLVAGLTEPARVPPRPEERDSPVNTAVEPKPPVAETSATSAGQTAPLQPEKKPADSSPPSDAPAPASTTTAPAVSKPSMASVEAPPSSSPAASAESKPAKAIFQTEPDHQAEIAIKPVPVESPAEPVQANPGNLPRPFKAAASKPPALPPVEVAATPPSAGSTEILEPAWVQTRDPGHYTLQLYRSKQMNGLEKFASSHRLPQPLSYFRTSVKAGSWYILVAGDYPDAQGAEEAFAELAASAPKLRPQLREFGEIQTQMR